MKHNCSVTKSKFFDFRGLGFKIWVSFFILSTFIVAGVATFQVISIKYNYAPMRRDQIDSAVDKGYTYYLSLNNNINNDIYKEFDKLAESKNVEILILAVEMEKNAYSCIYSSVYSKLPQSELDTAVESKYGENINEYFKDVSNNVKTLGLELKYNTQNVSAQDLFISGQRLRFSGDIFSLSGIYLYVQGSTAPIGSTLDIINSQLVTVSIIVFCIGFLLSLIISEVLSNPITSINKTAKKMANGDYSVLFNNKEYTEVKELSETLNYACEEFNKTEELRQSLIANVSHDLRTPLTLIKAYAEMIHDISGDDKDKRDEHTRVIIEEADRLSGLVSDMLDLSKLQSNVTEANIISFDLSGLLDTVIRRFKILEEKDGYTFDIDIEENLMVDCDVKRIEQVLYNLISNSVNYTGEDKLVRIKLYKDENFAHFEVTDSGVGIKPEEINQIWERYYRSHDPHKRASIGTGLGLSIVKGIYDTFSIDYGVDSVVDEGSTFWFKVKLS